MKRLLIDNGIDVLAIQETKVEGEEETALLLAPFLHSFEVCVSQASGLSGGCMLFFRKSLNALVKSVIVDSDGRFVICDCSINDVEYRIINLYAPNETNARKKFFQRIYSFLDCQRKLVMLGDFNCVCDARDRSSRTRHSDSSTRILNEMTTEFTLQDVAKYQSYANLWFTHFQSTSHARLDRVYVSIELLTGFDDYNVLPVYFSDHALVSFVVGGKKMKSSFCWDLWKLNNNLLEDELFNEMVDNLISGMLNVSVSASERWEWFKREVKLCAMERSPTLAYWKRAEERLLKEDLRRLCHLESENPGGFEAQLKQVKDNIAQL